MPARRGRKAGSGLSSGPPTKKHKPTPDEAHDLRSALLTNGTGGKKKLAARLSSSTADARSHHVQDGRTVVSKALGHAGLPAPDVRKPEVVEISSDESSSSSEDEDEDEEQEDQKPLTNGDTHMADESETHAAEDDDAGPSFGDLLQRHAPTTDIIVPTTDPEGDPDEDSADPAARPRKRAPALPPTGASLATVLAQALRTRDRDQLEACLATHDLDAVRSTIERLPAAKAEDLLFALASRLAARPGRASGLMVWLQWTLVAHGGYLARRPDVARRLGALQRAVRERAAGLGPLLALKGRLDMLAAQVELRRRRGVAEEEAGDEGVVVYVEGEEDDDEGAKAVGGADEDGPEEEAEAGAEQDVMELDDDDDEDDDDDSSVSEHESEASDRGFSDNQPESSDGSDSEEPPPEPKKKEKSKRSKRA
jgi:U3 small nucleolar RNA-associated protein 5